MKNRRFTLTACLLLPMYFVLAFAFGAEARMVFPESAARSLLRSVIKETIAGGSQTPKKNDKTKTEPSAKSGKSKTSTKKVPTEIEPDSPDVPGATEVVPLKNITDLRTLRKKCTDSEIQQAYDAALEVVTPLLGKSQKDQLKGIIVSLGRIYASRVEYSMQKAHYNDPYGFFILGVASCAGTTRTSIFCMRMLGFKNVEHVNESQYGHQWARVQLDDGIYWVADAQVMSCYPEPEPYGY